METTVRNEVYCIHSPLKAGKTACHVMETPWPVMRYREQEVWPRAFTVSSGEGEGKAE